MLVALILLSALYRGYCEHDLISGDRPADLSYGGTILRVCHS
jgi:hypothetical protein